MHDQDQKNCTMQYFLVLHKISVQVDELERMGLGARGQTRIGRFHMSLGSEWPCRLGCSLSLFPNITLTPMVLSLSELLSLTSEFFNGNLYES